MSSARILRTRSGRELRRIEVLPKKSKQHTKLQTNENKEFEEEIHVEKPEEVSEYAAITETVIPVKRKRGRPRNSERGLPPAKTEIRKVIETPPSKKKKLPKHSELTEEDNHNEEENQRRKPRMASLNALAKVNAVLECYRTDMKKEIQKQIQEIDKKCFEEQEKISPELSHKTEELDENVFIDSPEKDCVAKEKTENNEKYIQKSTLPKEKEKEVFKTVMLDKFIQTEKYHKSMQTEKVQFSYDAKKKLCTCLNTRDNLFPYYSPTNPYDYVNPVHVKSSAFAHTDTHKLVLPLVKTHALQSTSYTQFDKAAFTNNVSCLVDSCFTNALMQNSFPCSKLMYLSSCKDKNYALKEETSNWKNDQQLTNKNSKKRNGLSVPSLNYASLSVPNSKYHNDAKTNTVQKKVKGKNVKQKRCNGWEFEGEPVEETVKVEGHMVTRKYYQGLQRHSEKLKIHDAVLLKSGSEKTDADYVARLASLWEDSSGVYAGDMMMSVFWYYKPEQTNGKLLDVKAEQMEVFASRHKDDNSVACIIDRCFVVSFPQYCRFRAQNLIFQDNRKKKTSLVPESKKNNRSRLIPSPDVDPSIVFFSRYGYDYRTGKVLKNTPY